MNPTQPLLRWLNRVFPPPRGRHRPGAVPARPKKEHRPARLVPDFSPIRMDDPSDPRRYAMVRAPFLWWEALGERALSAPPALGRGALVSEGSR